MKKASEIALIDCIVYKASHIFHSDSPAISENQFGRLAQVEILHNILQQMGLLSFSTGSISASPKW